MRIAQFFTAGAVLLLACTPSLADDASFSTAAQMTFTVPTGLSGITYAVNNTIPTFGQTGPSTRGNAQISYGGQSWSWNNGVLSYNFPTSSGSAHSGPSFNNVAQFNSEYEAQLQITNSNNYAVRLPFTEWLSFEGSSTRHGLTADAHTQAFMAVFDQPSLTFPPLVLVTCEDGPGYCYSETLGSQGPITSSPISDSSSSLVPADSTATLWIIPDSSAFASVTNPTPEPGTLVLLGTGVTALIGIVLRTRRDQKA